MQAKIYECGNGFPDWSDYITDRDGCLYRVTGESLGPIQTGQPGEGNWLLVEVTEADWADLADGEEPFPALCVPNVHPGTRVEVQPPADYVAEYLRGLGREWLVWTDIHPLFYRCPGLEADALAAWIVERRPDLLDTVQDVLAEIRDEEAGR